MPFKLPHHQFSYKTGTCTDVAHDNLRCQPGYLAPTFSHTPAPLQVPPVQVPEVLTTVHWPVLLSQSRQSRQVGQVCKALPHQLLGQRIFFQDF
jgi:hypothetical protein